jgi:hypothetical protein
LSALPDYDLHPDRSRGEFVVSTTLYYRWDTSAMTRDQSMCIRFDKKDMKNLDWLYSFVCAQTKRWNKLLHTYIHACIDCIVVYTRWTCGSLMKQIKMHMHEP